MTESEYEVEMAFMVRGRWTPKHGTVQIFNIFIDAYNISNYCNKFWKHKKMRYGSFLNNLCLSRKAYMFNMMKLRKLRKYHGIWRHREEKLVRFGYENKVLEEVQNFEVCFGRKKNKQGNAR